MPHEQKLTAFILKKQPLNEADEIITFFTREHGKVRGLAKSIKLSKSKLQARLQMLFLVNFSLAGNKLPKITAVEIIEVYESLRADLRAVKAAFYACELIMRFTADEEKNEALFEILKIFFEGLCAVASSPHPGFLPSHLAKFKINVLEAVGLGIRAANMAEDERIFFNPSSGTFMQNKSGLGTPVSKNAYKSFLGLKESNYDPAAQTDLALEELNRLLSGFIEYQLERKIKSEKYLEINL